MIENWSVILNVLLLIGVVFAIVHTIRIRQKNTHIKEKAITPLVDKQEELPCDDIIAVRKISPDLPTDAPIVAAPKEALSISSEKIQNELPASDKNALTLMLFLRAKDDRQLVGYELLQTLLAAGLRFGEGHLFHRHLQINGQGPVLCSVAAATASGMFDLQNIGAFSVRGLCIFMQASGNPTIDAERFSIMLETATQLSEDLDTYLLDDNRQPFTDATLSRYQRLLKLEIASEKGIAETI